MQIDILINIPKKNIAMYKIIFKFDDDHVATVRCMFSGSIKMYFESIL